MVDPETQFVGNESEYGVAKSEASHRNPESTTPAGTETETESRGLFGFGGTGATGVTDGEQGESGGTDYSLESIEGGKPTGGTDYSAATALESERRPVGGTDYSGSATEGGHPTGGTDFSGAGLADQSTSSGSSSTTS